MTISEIEAMVDIKKTITDVMIGLRKTMVGTLTMKKAERGMITLNIMVDMTIGTAVQGETSGMKEIDLGKFSYHVNACRVLIHRMFNVF